MGKLICIKTYPFRAEAELAKGFLGENNIDATVLVSGMQPNVMSGTGGARLLVREEDREKALGLLETLKSDT